LIGIRIIKPSLLFLVLIAISGCSTVGYLAHTSNGHLAVISSKEPIADILAKEKYTVQRRQQLADVLRMRAFASKHIGLPSNKSYTEYVELNRDYVTWTIFATDELSLEPVTWCFWIVGCLPYRGYFSEEKAKQFAEKLHQSNHDVYIAPIPAYSTLGWFSDPLLSSMLGNGEIITAEYIFHELVHQQLYIKNDTRFNEAFASAVARMAVVDWLSAEGKTEDIHRYQQAVHKRDQLFALTKKLRAKLNTIYTSEISDQEKRKQKQQAFAIHQEKIYSLSLNWSNAEVYRKSVLAGLNNAKLNAQSTYNDLIASFIALFHYCDKNYQRFYEVVASMEKLNKAQRLEYLQDGRCDQIM
jgi:predicted aminopeptidase